MKISSFVAGIFCLAFGLMSFAEPAKPVVEPPAPAAAAPKTSVGQLDLQQKVGQLMIWTFSGTDFSKTTESILARYQPGALIAFSRNIKSTEQIAKFNAAAQKFASKKMKAPLFLMIDQEGGTVTRVKVSTPLPSALALGHMHNAAFIEDYAKAKAEMLAALGFNVNLSPVLDVSSPSSDSFIANRVFGEDPDEVGELGMAYARGISAAGLIPTAKHFPGHGGQVSDSHKDTPKKNSTWEDLEDRDLIPFVEFSEAKFPRAIMMAHLALPQVDPSGVPATYSQVIIQDHLRNLLAYKGLVITDDLEMGGASISEDIGERAVRAFLAGNDMLMLAGTYKNQRRAFDAVVAAAKSGRISEERLNESVTRILEAKAQLKPSFIRFEEKKTKDLRLKLEALSKEVMQKNFKDAMDSKTSMWPAVTPETRVLVMTSDGRFFRAFKDKFAGKTRFFHLTPDSLFEASTQIANGKNTLAVYYASGSKTAKWLNELTPELRQKVIVVNCNNPGKVDNQQTFLSVLNLNSHSPESGGWLAEALNTPPDMRAPATTSEDNEKEEPPPQEPPHEAKVVRKKNRAGVSDCRGVLMLQGGRGCARSSGASSRSDRPQATDRQAPARPS